MDAIHVERGHERAEEGYRDDPALVDPRDHSHAPRNEEEGHRQEGGGAVDRVELSTDGTTRTLATGTASWFGTLTLAEGLNTIYARATDMSDNSATVSISITVETGPPDGLLILLVSAIAIGAGAVITVAFLARRRRGPGKDEGQQ